ncbi:restriction endonuclease subunit S [Mammaliicoccus sciuri]|uniref:restriction endonuclease subunit S n=1 Tax=Mammaliicoccus sciuri TaxID=1296 RepID=UPI001FB55EC7|nr:restriction endonuclease subunit S [Mammaliicoccus sciuri]MCJ1778314.1 restriction endonuclease subunit S [Mammaliicoccus sciuri]
MTNEVKKVPELRFPEFDGEWEGIYLNKLGMFKKNYTFSRANEGDGTLRHIHYGDIHSKFKSKIEKIELLPSISIDLEDPQLVQNNDLIFADASEDYNDLGKTILMKVNNGNVIAGLHTHLFSPNNNLNSEFLLYFTQTKVYRKFIKRQGVGISVLGISKKNLDKLLVSLPKYNEQKKIGEFFSKLDRQIELEEQKLEKLEEQKKGYMQKIFSQELRFKDANGNDYPDWKKEKLDNILEFESERTKVENEYPVLTSSRNGLILQSEYYKEGKTFADSNIGYFIIPKGYITYRSRSDDGKFQFNLNNIIDVGIVSKYYPVFRGINMNQSFLTMLMNHQLKKEYIKFATGTSQLVLSQRNLREISTELPITEEQEKIGNFFDKQNSLIEKQSNKVELLKERKKGFLQKMFI